jgi:ubiquinone/menaquinone biosynthesis C-methylase UbiE
MTFQMQRRILPQLVWNQEVYGQRILEHLRSGMRWLDFGCGKRLLCNGLEKLESELAQFPCVGLDPNEENLKQQPPNVRCVLADGHYIPFADNSFDLITSNMVVEHLQDPGLAFRELHRILAPGGLILLHTPNLANYLVLGNHVLSAVLPHRLHAAVVGASEKRTEKEIYPTFYRANTRGKLRKLANSHLDLSVEFLPTPRPFFHFFAPVALMELLMTRLLQFGPLQHLSATMLISLQKPVPGTSREPMIPAA